MRVDDLLGHEHGICAAGKITKYLLTGQPFNHAFNVLRDSHGDLTLASMAVP
jgi:hypothetical protein